MSSDPKRRFDARTSRSMESIRALLDDHEIDNRLTAGQLHAAAVEALGMEPITFVCTLLAMCVHARSKVTIAPGEAAKIGLALMDRIYGPPDVKQRKKENAGQFELNFAWTTQAGRQEVTALFDEGDIEPSR